MQFIKRDAVRLVYEDTHTEFLPMIFTHGSGFDHLSLAQQINFFSRSHRVIAVDLRGDGMSDAPQQNYIMAGVADDIAWPCGRFELVKPIVLGHSMGGDLGLELPAQRPEIPSSLARIESVVPPLPELLEPLLAQFDRGFRRSSLS